MLLSLINSLINKIYKNNYFPLALIIFTPNAFCASLSSRPAFDLIFKPESPLPIETVPEGKVGKSAAALVTVTEGLVLLVEELEVLPLAV